MIPSINPTLPDEQHGFCPGRSTVTCNVNFCKYIYDTFKCRSQVNVIYTDFAKAFDTVNHDVLVSVLKALEFVRPLLDWLHSYLLNKPQWIKLFVFKFVIFSDTSGVSQVGHLSPILFTLFISSISKVPRHFKY